LARSPDGFLALTRVEKPVRASWLASGLQPDGFLLVGAPVRISAFPAGTAAGTHAVKATITLVPPPASALAQHTVLSMRLGSTRRTVDLAAGAPPRTVTLTGCSKDGAAVRGSLEALSGVVDAARTLGPALESVTVSAADGCPGPQG
jgi:hypothetical protein